MRKAFTIVSMFVILAWTQPARATTIAVGIDFQNLPVGSVPDLSNPYFEMVNIYTSAWNPVEHEGWSYDSINDYPNLAFFPEQGKIEDLSVSGVIAADGYEKNHAVVVRKAMPPPDLASEFFDDWPPVRVRIDAEFLRPVLEFSVDAFSDTYHSEFFYSGVNADGTPFEDFIWMDAYEVQHISVNAPDGGYITGFHFGQFDGSDSLRIGMDNLEFKAQVPESGNPAMFLGLGCIGLFWFVSRIGLSGNAL